MRRSGRIKKLKTGEDASGGGGGRQDEGQGQQSFKPAKSVRGGGKRKKENDPGSSKLELGTPSGAGAASATATTGNNPLENPVILSHLFKLCDAKLLANCRLVCKQWYQESLITWRTGFPITFLPSQDDGRLVLYPNIPTRIRGRFVATCRLALNTSLQQFLTYCDDPGNQCSSKPYRFFNMKSCYFHFKRKRFGELLDTLGSNVTTLHLSKCRFKDEEEFKKIIFTACPNLQTLKVNDCLVSDPQNRSTEGLEYREPIYGKHQHLRVLLVCWGYQNLWDGPPLQIPWLEVLSHFQSLTNLSLESSVREGKKVEEELKLLTDAVKIVRERYPKALPLKLVSAIPAPDILQCGDPISKENKTGSVIPLKGFCIQMKSDVNEAAVKNVLQCHRETVREIKIKGASRGTEIVLGQPFPFGVQLDKLTSLEIEKRFCERMAFLQHAPNLKELLITFDDSNTQIISENCQQEMALVRMVHPVKLTLYCNMSDQELAGMFEWIPNITSLEIMLDPGQLGVVCGKGKNLKSLTDNGWRLTDAEVTGMGSLGGELGKATRPNITDLQDLEYFEFSSHTLSEQSVFHGFLKMANLRKIVLRSRHHYLAWGKAAREALNQRNIKLEE